MRALYSLLIGALALLSACFTTPREAYTSDADLYQAAQEQLERQQWEPAIRILRALEEHFPFGTHAEQSQLELIYAYHRSNQPDLVAVTADRFIRLHPQHRNVYYVYYMYTMTSVTY